jgi:hypothetical protein
MSCENFRSNDFYIKGISWQLENLISLIFILIKHAMHDRSHFLQHRTFIIFFLLTFLFSCRPSGLEGKWKPVSQRFINGMQWQKPIQLNLNDPDSLKRIMLGELLKEQPPGVADSPSILHKIDEMVKHFQNARLILNADLNFTMINNGFILPNTIPGWHLGDTLMGTWMKQRDSLILNIGENENVFSIQYEIVRNNKDSLLLRELLYANESKPSREIVFIRE